MTAAPPSWYSLRAARPRSPPRGAGSPRPSYPLSPIEVSTTLRAVFLDRDGVINQRRPDHVKSPEEFAFLPGALAALKRLAATPFAILVVTNQAAVGRGQLSTSGLDAIHERMTREIAAAGGRIDAVYACPHTPDDRCTCRKPEPGLFLEAARDWDVDLRRSYCVGDSATDIEAGNRVGCRGLLIATGEPPQHHQMAEHHLLVPNLQEAVERILSLETGEGA